MMMSIKRYASSIQIGMPTRVSAPVPTRLQSVQGSNFSPCLQEADHPEEPEAAKESGR